MLTTHYTELFTKSQTNWMEVVNCIDTKITTAQNAKLMKPVATKEVKEPLFQMHPDKSPELDGMTLAFCLKHWKIVGSEVVDLVRQFFLTGDMYRG